MATLSICLEQGNETINRYPLIATCLIVFVVAIFAGIHHSASNPPVPGTLTPSAVDFGNVKLGTTEELRVEVRNNGSQELRVARISTDCGCLRATLDSKVLRPGEASWLSISLSATRIADDVAQAVFVFTEGVLNPSIVSVRYSVKPNQVVVRPSHFSMGRVNQADLPLSRLAEVALPENVSTFSVQSSAPSTFECTTNDDNRVSVTLMNNGITGGIRETIQLGSGSESTSVLATAYVIGPLYATPSMFSFATDDSGSMQPVTVDINMRKGESDVRIGEPKLSSNFSEAFLTSRVPSGSGTAKVLVQARGQVARLTTSREFGYVDVEYTNGEDEGVLRIPIELY